MLLPLLLHILLALHLLFFLPSLLCPPEFLRITPAWLLAIQLFIAPITATHLHTVYKYPIADLIHVSRVGLEFLYLAKDD